MTPSMEDIKDAIEVAKKENCIVGLHWNGPGFRWYGDAYSRYVTADSVAEEIYETLPKIYGI